jgi:ubiquinone/menaquinone biosynthesis C-methylase UbiE
MDEKKFDPKKLQKLNNPKRLIDIPPAFIAEKLGNPRPEVMVDIGAGTGFLTLALRDQLRPQKTYGCDLSQVMLDWMRANVLPQNPDLQLVKTEEDRIPLESEIADLLYMITLHHELHNPNQTLAECHRLLKPGGQIFIVDWKKEEMTEGPSIVIRCTTEEIAVQMSQAGFTGITPYHELAKHFLVVGRK